MNERGGTGGTGILERGKGVLIGKGTIGLEGSLPVVGSFESWFVRNLG